MIFRTSILVKVAWCAHTASYAMRRKRIAAPSEVKESTVVNGAVAGYKFDRFCQSLTSPCWTITCLQLYRIYYALSEWSQQGVATAGTYLRVSEP